MVDAVQDIVIRESDCGQTQVHWVTRAESEIIGEAFENRIFGRTLAENLIDETTGELIAAKGVQINEEIAAEIKKRAVSKAPVFSVMTCQTENGICQKCYGHDLGNNKLVEPGTPVGIIAAQSIGEPGTQLTMRTFHMGGVAGEGDITQGLTRVEELFEARPPKTPATLAEVSGKIKIEYSGESVRVHVSAEGLGEDAYSLEREMRVAVKEGETIKENQILAKGTVILRSIYGGKVTKVTDDEILVRHTEPVEKSYDFPAGTSLLVENHQTVEAGDALTKGHFDLRHFMGLKGVYDVQRYLMNEVQGIYASQGQSINDKHIEIIVKEMFSRVRVVDPGDLSDLLAGEQTDFRKIVAANLELKAAGKRPATFERLLLGLTRISLATDSWLSAASFQETIRVLVEASTTGKIDNLEGLKENVIIGKLIPAGHIYQKRFYANLEKQKKKAE